MLFLALAFRQNFVALASQDNAALTMFGVGYERSGPLAVLTSVKRKNGKREGVKKEEKVRKDVGGNCSNC